MRYAACVMRYAVCGTVCGMCDSFNAACGEFFILFLPQNNQIINQPANEYDESE